MNIAVENSEAESRAAEQQKTTQLRHQNVRESQSRGGGRGVLGKGGGLVEGEEGQERSKQEEE